MSVEEKYRVFRDSMLVSFNEMGLELAEIQMRYGIGGQMGNVKEILVSRCP